MEDQALHSCNILKPYHRLMMSRSRLKEGKRCSALFFFCNRGKYGFRREPITPSEHDILIKAWISTVVFHYYGEEGRERPVLDLGTERKRYGLGIEKRIIQSHIAYAQTIAGHIITLAWYGQRLTALRGSTPSGLTREVLRLSCNLT